MIANLLDMIAGLVLPLSNPLVLTDLGLAALHALAAHYHLKHEDGRPLALCYSLMSAFYVVLAVQHGVAH